MAPDGYTGTSAAISYETSNYGEAIPSCYFAERRVHKIRMPEWLRTTRAGWHRRKRIGHPIRRAAEIWKPPNDIPTAHGSLSCVYRTRTAAPNPARAERRRVGNAD